LKIEENRRISNFKGLMTLIFDRCHMAYCRASLIDLYLYTKFHRNRKNFLWMDVRTYVRTYVRTDVVRRYVRTNGHLSPIWILLGRLFGVDIKIDQTYVD